ncbi:hypothetical protein E2C01_067902 [Portunus trituberculatus]|uniref:Uncharacterized protein n=1 Tax=Portunus trituberculatus TaxID=210409 RepID=A0A5B7HY21_PORTR|nr:hypothetical protein [Portunus trituberculatus]
MIASAQQQGCLEVQWSVRQQGGRRMSRMSAKPTNQSVKQKGDQFASHPPSFADKEQLDTNPLTVPLLHLTSYIPGNCEGGLVSVAGRGLRQINFVEHTTKYLADDEAGMAAA